jgi:hypothetical protein
VRRKTFDPISPMDRRKLKRGFVFNITFTLGCASSLVFLFRTGASLWFAVPLVVFYTAVISHSVFRYVRLLRRFKRMRLEIETAAWDFAPSQPDPVAFLNFIDHMVSLPVEEMWTILNWIQVTPPWEQRLIFENAPERVPPEVKNFVEQMRKGLGK